MDPISKFLNEMSYKKTPQGKINAPTMAYYTVYERYPTPPISGRESSHPTYNLNGVDIDERIPKDVMQKLFQSKVIETRASCQGDSDRHLTFLIFRLKDRSIGGEEIDKIVDNIARNKNYKAFWNIGSSGLPRICVSAKLWYSEENREKFLKWWKELPEVITKVIGRI